MKPYYQADGITIYHGDCLEILPTLARPVAIVTDQPYGTGWVRGGKRVGEFVAFHEIPAWDRWDMSWLELVNIAAWAIFGPVSKEKALLELSPKPSVMAKYRKTNPRPKGPDWDPIAIGPLETSEQLEYRCYNGDTTFHPCQKPLELMKWLVGLMPDGLDIVDPFMGSGSTLVAAKELGRRAIGMEKNATYCERAVGRLSQQVMNFNIANEGSR